MLKALNRRLRFRRGNNDGGDGSHIPGQTLNWNSSPGNLVPQGFTLTRASTGTYFDSTGLLQTAAIDAARGTYRWNGSVWVFDGTIVEAAAATNSLLRSRALGTAPWVLVGTAGAQNATGIDGSANTAWTLTDASAVAVDGYYTSGSITITANTNPNAFSVRVLKDANSTTFPALRVISGGGLITDLVFNTSTGAFTAQQIAGTGGGNVEDEGLWWKVTCYVNNNGFDVSIACVFFPAYTTGTTASAASVAAQRSCVVDQFDHRPNSQVTDSPIITAGVAVTRAADVLTAPTAGLLVNGQGFAAIGYRAIAGVVGANAGYEFILSTFTGTGGVPIRTFGPSFLGLFDTTDNRITGPALANTPGTVYKVANTWSGSSCVGAVNGSLGSAATFDSDMGLGATLRIGDNPSPGTSIPLSIVLQSLRLGVQAVGSGRLASPFT